MKKKLRFITGAKHRDTPEQQNLKVFNFQPKAIVVALIMPSSIIDFPKRVMCNVRKEVLKIVNY